LNLEGKTLVKIKILNQLLILYKFLNLYKQFIKIYWLEDIDQTLESNQWILFYTFCLRVTIKFFKVQLAFHNTSSLSSLVPSQWCVLQN